MKKELQQLNIGILGGGQLGRMLLQEATNWDLKIAVLDPAHNAPCANMTHEFAQGDFKDFDTVYQFGKNRDIVTIEFEDVNADALEALEKEGVKVYPQPNVLKIIKDKGAQKTFYTQNNIPTAPYALVDRMIEIQDCGITFPFFQKLRKGGYDGYGVKKITNEVEMGQAFDAPSVIEEQADLYKELSVIVARNQQGEVKTFPLVDMEFNSESNMVQFLFAPAEITAGIEERAIDIAKLVIEKLEMVGLLAVELFLTKQGEIWVNEIAPRPHNSGHHTIEANICSQYEQHLRAICDLPLGDTTANMSAVMVNLLGEKECFGVPYYEGFDRVVQIPGVYVHLYGKGETKPFRKMGHVTIIDENMQKAKEKALEIRRILKVKTK